MSTNTDVVRAVMAAYLGQDEATAQSLIAGDLRFTSPQDDHIDRAAYFERCFPTAGRVSSQTILHVADADEETVFLLYEYTLATGETHRNTEVHTVRDGQIQEIQVFFGGRYDV